MLDNEEKPFIAVAGDKAFCLIPKMANRHGLITGATGTGKTVTLQTMAETFSSMGVPVFAADVKGDLSGVAKAGGNKDSVKQRVESYKLNDKGFSFQAFPVQFWDVFGEQGAPVRATIADMGPLLLSRLLNLNETQSAVLTVVFKMAEDEKLELIDLKDLQKILQYTGDNTNKLATKYGNISTASLGAIQRNLLALDQEGAGKFFGEPSLDINDIIQTAGDKGVINILASDKLMLSPKIYSTFLLWLMNKLFTVLPEVGDMEKPKLVFFFDEAHLLFKDAPKVLVDKVEQVVRLVRSKGVGIYFISQTPSDMPDSILGQLGNRVQHALRAYTPSDQKALKAAAQSFRANPAFSTEEAIAQLGTGEALISFLDAKGAPTEVERAFILPPEGQIGPIVVDERKAMLDGSIVFKHYKETIDRSSAFEILSERLENTLSEKELAAKAKEEDKQRKEAEKEAEKARKEEERRQKAEEKARLEREKLEQKAATQQRKFWGGIATSILVPVAKQLFRSFTKKR